MSDFTNRLKEAIESSDAAWTAMSEDEKSLRRRLYPDVPITDPIPTPEEYEKIVRKRQLRSDHNERIRRLASAYRDFGYEVDVAYDSENGLRIYVYNLPRKLQINLPPTHFYDTKLV
jgi:hypothetical protein